MFFFKEWTIFRNNIYLKKKKNISFFARNIFHFYKWIYILHLYCVIFWALRSCPCKKKLLFSSLFLTSLSPCFPPTYLVPVAMVVSLQVREGWDSISERQTVLLNSSRRWRPLVSWKVSKEKLGGNSIRRPILPYVSGRKKRSSRARHKWIKGKYSNLIS